MQQLSPARLLLGPPHLEKPGPFGNWARRRAGAAAVRAGTGDAAVGLASWAHGSRCASPVAALLSLGACCVRPPAHLVGPALNTLAATEGWRNFAVQLTALGTGKQESEASEPGGAPAKFSTARCPRLGAVGPLSFSFSLLPRACWLNASLLSGAQGEARHRGRQPAARTVARVRGGRMCAGVHGTLHAAAVSWSWRMSRTALFAVSCRLCVHACACVDT